MAGRPNIRVKKLTSILVEALSSGHKDTAALAYAEIRRVVAEAGMQMPDLPLEANELWLQVTQSTPPRVPVQQQVETRLSDVTREKLLQAGDLAVDHMLSLMQAEGLFLTPFKVRQMASTIDEYVYDGTDMVVAGEIEEGEAFTESDFNTRIIIPDRELARVREFMEHIDQRQKALVFCATQNHAALVRDLINQVKTSPNPNYCHRVTADDGAIGDQHLRDFQDNEKTIPTILTTSQKLSTGVDARNVRHIVLMRPIRSMIEFKQIIGRGTRTYDGKDFFTIWDFVRAHENFNDPEWDGEPLAPEPPGPPRTAPEPAVDPTPSDPGAGDDEDEGPRQKIVVELSDGKARTIRFIAATTYWSADGKPITAAEFLARLFGDLSKMIADEDQLRAAWSDPDNRAHFLKQLEDNGYDEDRLEDIRQLVDASQSDLFDVLAYVLFTNPPKTRQDRAQVLRESRMGDFQGEMADLLLVILRAYEAKGESELATRKLGQFLTARYGSVGESKGKLGELASVRDAFKRMQAALYAD